MEECATNVDNCHADANCTNTKGSFDCTCHTGYSGDGFICDGMLRIDVSVLLFSLRTLGKHSEMVIPGMGSLAIARVQNLSFLSFYFCPVLN